MRYLPIILALTAGVPALAETIKITAGENNKFDPESVTAKSGDILEFRFGPKNHSVAMGEFDSINGPCVPANEGGFFSGYFAVDSGESDKVFRVTVNDTEPIVFYSTQGWLAMRSMSRRRIRLLTREFLPQGRECSEGMIGAVNLASENDLSTYRDKASKLSQAVAPRDVFGGVVADADSSSEDNDDSKGNQDKKDGEGAAASVRVGLASACVAALVALMV
ncbi:hypothetical protein SAPIO_CDS4987 [Scedosporium apiospermum]|uniref:Extracellular serine-rich protein n=1 Tax=Pseudallescheria apiosperma TaxID=563466 RepID=A0A084G6Z7_PSEDA|nr:uncharacterized protein SAPIO_CDS4987 [Scedosporium apiospermum]KEZ43109.1 hypothetical protein SAPIO_CDS4987 [Scedosporium apiospermum]